MADLEKVLASLSPEKRALLEKKIKEKGKSFNSFPLSYSQRRLWFLDKLDKGSTAYTIPTAIKLTGNLKVDILKQSFTKIIERHEVLRTKIVTIKEEPVQVVTKNNTLIFNQIDLSKSKEKDDQFKKSFYADIATPFLLNDVRLFRISLYKFDKNEYLLTLLMHHIISDGWSVGIFIRELTEIYNSLLNNKEPILPELIIQYADFAKWQQKWQDSSNFNDHLEYWKENFKSIPEKLQLPLDYQRPLMKRFNGKVISSKIDKRIVEKIKLITKSENVTMFMLLIAVYKVMLNKITGQDDLSIGTPIANRNKSEVENLIGFFVNTLVIRTEINDEENFFRFLQSVKTTLLDAYSHQEIPFEYLVEILNPERDLSTTPLFQTMFVYQSAGNQKLDLVDVEISPFPIENTTAKFDLTLMVTETENGEMQVSFEYDIDLFSDKTIERFLVYYKKCLDEIVDAPTKSLKDITILSKSEYEDLIYTRNETEKEFSSSKTLSQLFEEEVVHNPNLIAVNFEGRTITYNEFNVKANQLAHHLLANNIGVGDVVGIYMTPTIETIVAIIAVLKIGASYLPLDPNYPDERIAFMISDSKTKILLHNITINKQLSINNAITIELSSNSKIFSSNKENNIENKLSSNLIAYIIYTSGSTGKPKGVICNHTGVVNVISDFYSRKEFKKGAKYSLWTTINFDVSISEIFSALITGGELHIVPFEKRSSEEMFFGWLEEHKIQAAYIPPFMLSNFAKQLKDEKHNSYLERILVGVEPIQNKILYSLKQSLPNCNIQNGYGPTETTIWSTLFNYNIQTKNSDIVPIGYPIANTKIFILDKKLFPVPTGVTGEVYIQSIGIAHGYVNRADLTSEKFLPNPFSKVLGERMYKTGDIAKHLPSGAIKFIGRTDTQIKIRGFRVELEEIENELLQLNEIEKVIILSKDNLISGKILIAYLILKEHTKKDEVEIRRWLSEVLPDYMIPSIFVYLDVFPVLPNGKVDKKSLPSPDGSSIDFQHKFIPPRTKTEIKICSIISDVLDIKKIGIKDNFFKLGGHSLMATRVITRIKDELNVDLPLKVIFEKPEVKELANVVDNIEMLGSDIKLEKLPKGHKKQLSYAQERLWFLDQLDPGNSAYNIPSVIKLTGKVNLDIFNYSFNEIIKRHEVLRSSIKTIDGKSDLRIEDEIDFVVDIVKLDAGISKKEIEEIIIKESFNPFNLAEPPLLRAKMLILNNEESVFILTLHHIISDGWSAGIFISEFGEIYKSKLNDKIALLPKLNFQYSEYAAWQKKWLQGDILEKQISYWEKQLAGIPPLINLPTNSTRPPIQTFNGALQKFEISSEISEQLSKIAQENNATLFMVLLAILQTLLHRYSGQDDICIGTPVANRNRAEIENLIGFFINTIVIRGDLSGAPSFLSLLKRIQETSIEAMEHQDIPFEKLIDNLNIERNVSHSPVFQVMFTFQNLPESRINLPDLTLEQLPLESENAKFDLNITMTELPNGMLTGAFEYNTDLFYSSTIEKMVNHFSTLTKAICINPNLSIDQFAFVSDPEKQLLLKEWNRTKLETPSINLLHALFEDTAISKPNNTAVIYKGNSLSFQELNERSNQLANYLLSKGIKNESSIGICLDRSVEMMTSIIAIWKAGCAYVPIDPELPEDRVQHIIEDSEAKIIISNNVISNKFKETFSNKILIDDHWNLIQKKSSSNIALIIDSKNLAYIIYTSGSTGNPKGVMVAHCSAINLAMELNNTVYKSNNENVISLNAPISFDASVQQIVMMLYGNTLNIIPQEVRLDGEALVDFITKNKIDILDCVPTQLGMMIENNLFTNSEWKPSVILPGGEAINDEMWRRICENDGIRFLNMYGPTECTVDSTICEIAKNINKPSIGKPINNNTHFVLDENLQIVPIGVAGELFIGGKGVSRGYLNNSILTAEKYLPNPFNEEQGERLYRTGDLVRYLSDGNLEYLGRVDHQVKLRGFRIELGEIEYLLNSHSQIKESVVIVREDEPNIKRLIGYFVPIENATISIIELRDFLVAKLPNYMVPAQIIQLDSIPLTPTGKINRSILPKPEIEKIDVSTIYEEPKTKNEIILAEAVQEVLNIKKVGIHDNFFELGGDSIIGIQVISKAKQAGLYVTPVQLFQHQTVYKLALAGKEVNIIKAEQGIVSGEFEFTPIQKTFIEQNYTNRNHWNQSLLFKVNKNLEEEILNKVIVKLYEHHDALRIRVINEKQKIIHELDGVSFEYIDLSKQKNSTQILIEDKCQEVQGLLNIVDGPIFKIVYFHLGNNDGRILFVFHHIAIDGVSWRIILEDFQILYNAFEKNIEFDLPAKTTSVKEWSEKLLLHASSPSIINEKQYWSEKAERYKKSINVDFENGSNDENSGKTISMVLDEPLTNKLLKEVNKKYNTKIDDILLSALLISFSKWSSKRSMFLNLEGHGRNGILDEIDLSRTVGWFTTIYPLQLELKKAITIEESIKVIKEQIRNIPNDGLGYGLLRHINNDVETKNKLSVLDSIGITFNYLGQFDNILSNESIFEPANENKGLDRALNNKRTSLIDVSGNVFANQLRIIFNYSANMFKEESISEWMNLYMKSLKEIISDCTADKDVSFTSSDFELSKLSDKKLNKVLAKLKKK